MEDRAIKILSKINMEVIRHLNSSLMIKQEPRAALEDIFSSAAEGRSLKRHDSPVDLAAKGSREARQALIDRILILLTKDLKVTQSIVDVVLEGYYINYYGKPEDISSTKSELLYEFLNKILISKDADPDEKIEKLAQVIYQESFGYGVLDEFRYIGMNEKYDKIEEIFIFGPETLSLKISGLDYKLDKLYYPEEQIDRVVSKLARSSVKGGLTKANPKVETELLDQSRVTLYCFPLTKYSAFNIRLHYSSDLKSEDLIRLGTSSVECERWQDLIMNFKPRIGFYGGQGTGKTTLIVNMCRRYERNLVIVTGESAFELGLEKIEHLIVNPMKLGILSNEEFLKSLFRQNAKMLLMGEARDAEDSILITQAAQRTEFGTIFSWHTGDVLEGIYGMANGLVRSGAFKTLFEAVREVCNSVDFVIVPRIADESSKTPGKRHIYQIVEIGKVNNPGDEPKLRVIFEFDYVSNVLRNTGLGISGEMATLLAKRQPLKSEYLRILQSGKYIYS